jgi:hypothetical protein
MKSREERLAEYVRLSDLLPQAKAILMAYPGVREVAVGVKEEGGKLTEVVAFRVYVAQKKPEGAIPPGQMIPPQVLGVPTDVVLEPAPRLIEDTDKYRPLLGGVQIGNDTSSGTGTLGCIAQLTTDNSLVMLSNHHVMMSGGASVGEKIGQPEISCCCCCKGNIVGTVLNALDNALVDCAIARITDQPGFIMEVVDIGLLLGSAPLVGGSTVAPLDRVRKRGKRTELTIGTVVTPSMSPGSGKTNQIEIRPTAEFKRFAYFGDSGSVVVNDANQVVGLLYAIDGATETLGYANIITNVMSAMSIRIIDGGTPGTIPLSSTMVAEASALLDVDDAPLREIARVLQQSEKGRRVLALVERHRREINQLLNDSREVKVAWHRFQGPAFTAHVVKSVREHDHAIPTEIEGISPANLLIRMSVVLQDHGSPSLKADVEASTLPLLDLLSAGGRVHDLLERFLAEDTAIDAVGVSTR